MNHNDTNELLLRCIQAFKENAPVLVSEICSGVEHNTADQVMRAAHTLKSNSGSLGVMRLMESCRQMEEMARRGDLDGADVLIAAIQQQLSRAIELLDSECKSQAA